MKIKRYETEIKNLNLFISHRVDGITNASYLLVNDEGDKGVEIIPVYGPLTFLAQDNLIDSYINGKIEDRGNWSQASFDEMQFNSLLSGGDLEAVARLLNKVL